MNERVYKALVRENGLLELPKQAEALCLTPGEKIDVAIRVDSGQHGVGPALDSQASELNQAQFRQLAARLFAETDAIERTPEELADPVKRLVSDEIVKKHREIGLNL